MRLLNLKKKFSGKKCNKVYGIFCWRCIAEKSLHRRGGISNKFRERVEIVHVSVLFALSRASNLFPHILCMRLSHSISLDRL